MCSGLENTSNSLTLVVLVILNPAPTSCSCEFVETSAQDPRCFTLWKFETKTLDILPDSQFSKIQIRLYKL
jgi:hypothetical protein